MRRYRVGVIGCTGMVGQRFIELIDRHPWFTISALAASSRSAGKSYEEAVRGRWYLDIPIPESVKGMRVYDAERDIEKITSEVDFVFCAVNMPDDEVVSLEQAYAKRECPVISNNKQHRFFPDVPMVIPELNPQHLSVIETQRKRLGTKKGFVAVKSNCSLQSYVPAIHPLLDRGVTKVLACTYQAISGAGKTFGTMPEILDNVIPYIKGEEEKSEKEPMKIWGRVENGVILNASSPSITSQCLRVPVSDGHMAAVFMSMERKLSVSEIIERWEGFKAPQYVRDLPSAPKQFLHYFYEDDRPQTKLDRDLEGGMAISIGRLRPDKQYDYKFVCLSHNTIRGAAGGGVLLAELLCSLSYMD